VKTHTLLIQTPEGIAFPLLLASPVTRMLACTVDLVVVIATVYLIGVLVAMVGWIAPSLSLGIHLLAYFAITIGYGIATEWLWRGQTLGKRLLRLRVMDAQGLRLQFSQIVIRNLLRFVDGLPAFYLVGGLASLLSPRAQRLGDLAANTIVVRHPAMAEPDVDQLMAGKFNSLRDHPHLVARLRQRVSPAEAAIALQALLRRDEFEPAARVGLFGQLASHFRSLAAFPLEAVEGLTDEQYVRNVVDVLFRARGERAASADKSGPTAAVPYPGV